MTTKYNGKYNNCVKFFHNNINNETFSNKVKNNFFIGKLFMLNVKKAFIKNLEIFR